MRMNRNAHRRNATLIPSVALWTGLVVAGLVGNLWSLSAAGVPGVAFPLAGVLALTSVIGAAWQSRARARGRWRQVLDAFADREIARAGRHPRVSFPEDDEPPFPDEGGEPPPAGTPVTPAPVPSGSDAVRLAGATQPAAVPLHRKRIRDPRNGIRRWAF